MTEEERQQAQFNKMTKEPIPKLVGTLAIPTIISMLVTNIYNMVDTAFVGKLGNSQSAAVGVVFGYMAIIQAVGFMCGQGSGSIMSRRLGNKDLNQASGFSSTGFFLSFGLGIVIGLFSMIFLGPLVRLLGSTPTMETYAKDYVFFIILAAPFMTSSLTLNNLLRYEGKAKLGMIGLMTGAVLNICGDALFMFGMNLGVKGAGISTALSQTISFSILLYMFLSGKTQTHISIKRVFFAPGPIFTICATGFPSMIRQALNSISIMLLNDCAKVYGDEAVAAMSIVSRISFFVISVSIGIGQGFQPVSSFNYGAAKYDRVRKAFWFTCGLSECLCMIFASVAMIYAKPICSFFRDDPVVISYAVRALRLQCASLILVPLSMCVEMGYQSTGQKLLASFASSLRSGVLFMPALLILANLRGMKGVQEAQPVSNIIAFLIGIPLAMVYLRKLKDKEAKLSNPE